MKKLSWKNTTYSDGSEDFPAVFISWEDVKEFLGEPHTGGADQDERLIAGLRAAGGPGWVQDAPGWVDEHGWGLYQVEDA